MKKSLIALAALAATTAFAQSSVTISGNLDYAGSNTSGTVAGVKGTTFATTTGTSSTSVLRFIAVEDLGGGLKATAQYNFDPRSLSNDSTALTNSADATPTKNTMTALARDEIFIGLSGGFGTIKLGSPNALGLLASGVSSPLGTGIGSAYTGGGAAGTMTNSYVNTRYNRSAMYVTPVMSGFSATVVYAPGNDEAMVAGGVTGLGVPNARKTTEVGLNYANGPLNVAFVNISQAKQTNATGWYSSATLANSASTSVNMLAANYNFGSTTVYALWNKGDALAAATTAKTAEGYRVALKQTVGMVDLMAQYTSQKTDGVEAKVSGIRADYKLSNTAAVYAGYEDYNTGAATLNTRKTASVGVRKSF